MLNICVYIYIYLMRTQAHGSSPCASTWGSPRDTHSRRELNTQAHELLMRLNVENIFFFSCNRISGHRPLREDVVKYPNGEAEMVLILALGCKPLFLLSTFHVHVFECKHTLLHSV